MTTRKTPAGATPVAESAMLSQSYPFGPWWAPYRVPRPGMNGLVDPRAVGIVFRGDSAPDAGAAGGAGGSGSDSPPAGSNTDGDGDKGGSTDSGADQSATDDAALGEPGKRALEREREARKAAEDRAKAAEKERDEAKLANASEQERAIAAAKAEGKNEVLDQLHTVVRRTAVREALIAAGAPASLVADLSKADEFAALKVTDDNEIDAKELRDAVKAHKERVPDAYRPAGESGGTADGGSRGGGAKPRTYDEAIAQHYGTSRPA